MRWWLGLPRVSTFLIALVVLIVVPPGCKDDQPARNSLPDIGIVSCPPEAMPLGSDCAFSWWASDEDGQVVGYYYGLDDDTPGVWITATACTVQVTLSGAHTFYLQAEDNKGGRSEVDSCGFTMGEAVPGCVVAPASLDFGSLTVGSTAERSFTITNDGTGTLAGTVTESCGEYELVSGGGAYSLSPAAVRTVTVRFSPSASGTYTCSIDLGAEACTDVSCSGTATDVTACGVGPTSLDFGTVDVGSTADRTFTITNNGTGTLAGTVTESCDHYQVVSGGGAYSLAPAAVRTVTVRFAPTASGTHACTVNLGAAACTDVSCSGTAVDVTACDVNPTSLDFGSVSVQSTVDRTFTITNNGTGTLAGSVTESCDHYQVVSGGGAYSLAPAAVRTVTVRFAPTASGTHACTVDLGVSACSDVACTGTATDVIACDVSPASLDFGNVDIGSLADLTFTITNNGTASVAGMVSEGCEFYHVVYGNGAYTLAPGDSRAVIVRFVPLQAGSFSCQIDLGSGSCGAVSCSATGVALGGTEFKANVIFAYQWAMDLISAVGNTFTFELGGMVPDVNVGDVILGLKSDLTPYVRKVVSVVRSGSQLILEMIEASLVDIYKEVDKTNQFTLPITDPGSAGEILDGVRIADGGLEWDGFTVAVPSLGYVAVKDAYVHLDNFTIDTGYRIANSSVAELQNLINVDITFGCDLSAGLDLGAPGVTRTGSYTAPEVKIYENTKTFQSQECAPPLDCPFSILPQVACVNYGLGVPELCTQQGVDAACARWAASQPDVCVNLCHEVTYTVYLGGVYDWSFTNAPGEAGPGAAPSGSTINLGNLDGGVSLEVGEKYLNGAWDFIRDSAKIPSQVNPSFGTYSVIDMKPYVVVEIRDKVHFCDLALPPFTAPVTRITYYLHSTEPTTSLTEWCLDVQGGRTVEILNTEIPPAYADYLARTSTRTGTRPE